MTFDVSKFKNPLKINYLSLHPFYRGEGEPKDIPKSHCLHGEESLVPLHLSCTADQAAFELLVCVVLGVLRGGVKPQVGLTTVILPELREDQEDRGTRWK